MGLIVKAIKLSCFYRSMKCPTTKPTKVKTRWKLQLQENSLKIKPNVVRNTITAEALSIIDEKNKELFFSFSYTSSITPLK